MGGGLLGRINATTSAALDEGEAYSDIFSEIFTEPLVILLY